jgi:hypothetical protein
MRSLRDATVFARRKIYIDLNGCDAGCLERVHAAKLATFFFDSKNETILARGSESSVSHFIDCHAVARRL